MNAGVRERASERTNERNEMKWNARARNKKTEKNKRMRHWAEDVVP